MRRDRRYGEGSGPLRSDCPQTRFSHSEMGLADVWVRFSFVSDHGYSD